MTDDPFRHFVRWRRRELGMGQPALADYLSVSPGFVSHLETGRRPLTPLMRRRLDVVMALGQREDGDESPVQLLALASPTVPPRLLRDDHRAAGAFESAPRAEAAAESLRSLGLGAACAIPAWSSFGFQCRDLADRVDLLDDESDPAAGIAIAEFVAGCLRANRSGDSGADLGPVRAPQASVNAPQSTRAEPSTAGQL